MLPCNIQHAAFQLDTIPYGPRTGIYSDSLAEYFPPDGGVSEVLSPHAIFTGFMVDYAAHCCIKYGAYVQVHEQHDNSNPLGYSPPSYW
jgi:hypothetical protein